MHRLFFSYFFLFSIAFCLVSILEYSCNISFELENVYAGDFFSQYSDFSSDLSEEENENETYTFQWSSHFSLYLFAALNEGFKKIDHNFIFLHYEVNSEPPELKA